MSFIVRCVFKVLRGFLKSIKHLKKWFLFVSLFSQSYPFFRENRIEFWVLLNLSKLSQICNLKLMRNLDGSRDSPEPGLWSSNVVSVPMFSVILTTKQLLSFWNFCLLLGISEIRVTRKNRMKFCQRITQPLLRCPGCGDVCSLELETETPPCQP